MAFTQINDSALIGTTEYYLGADSTTKALQTTECSLQVFIFIAAMAAGDQFRVRIYREINNQETTLEEFFLTHPKTSLGLPGLFVGGVSGAWDISVTKITGTDRTVHWCLFQAT